MTHPFRPTFLGLAAPRSGTTWLHEALASHPEIAMPERRKELHFYDQNHHRGADWYRSWFGDLSSATAIGEITPHYLYDAAARERIQASGVERFVVVLRDPVARAVSHHRFRQRVDGSSSSFADFLAAHPEAVEWGRYATHLRPWITAFGREGVCALRFERATAEPAAALAEVSSLIGVEPGRFPRGTGQARTNASPALRRPRSYAIAKAAARRLRAADVRWAGPAARRLGIDRLLTARGTGGVARDLGLEADLRRGYREEIADLEDLLGWDLGDWRAG